MYFVWPILVGLASLEGCSTPTAVPDTPGVFSATPYLGAPATADPLPGKDVIAHPLLGENSVFHEDHYNSDVTDQAGPLGIDPKVRSRLYGQCSTPRVDSQGRVITLCLDISDLTTPGLRLVLLDGDTLELLAERRVDDAPLSTVTAGNTPGGAYPHVDAQDRVLTTNLSNQVVIYEAVTTANGSLSWDLTSTLDLSSHLATGDVLFDAVPDFTGRLWFVSGQGRVGAVDAGGTVQTTDLGETVENGLAIGEDGVFLTTAAAAYRFEADPTGAPTFTWRIPYSVDPNPKPGVFSAGSGGTITLLGRDLVVFPDNAPSQVNLLVARRDQSFTGPDRVICQVPLFSPGQSAVDVSPIAYGRSIVVANFFGAPNTLDFPATFDQLAPGLTRIDVRPDNSGCDVVWTNNQIRSTTVAKLSTATGLVYTFRQRLSESPVDAFYFTAVDFDTGNIVWEVLSGTGPLASNSTFTLAVGRGGQVYQATVGGIVRLEDGPGSGLAPSLLTIREEPGPLLMTVLQMLGYAPSTLP